jgi:hypothetical protein
MNMVLAQRGEEEISINPNTAGHRRFIMSGSLMRVSKLMADEF